MAKVSSAILTTGMVEVAKILADSSPTYTKFVGMGVGNTSAAAAAGNTDLGATGTNVKYVNSTHAYSASNKGKWQHTWTYSDLSGHIFKEVVVCMGATTHASTSLLRAVYNTETLGSGDTLQLTVTCEVKQGS